MSNRYSSRCNYKSGVAYSEQILPKKKKNLIDLLVQLYEVNSGRVRNNSNCACCTTVLDYTMDTLQPILAQSRLVLDIGDMVHNNQLFIINHMQQSKLSINSSHNKFVAQEQLKQKIYNTVDFSYDLLQVDISYLMYSLPENITNLILRNSNIEFNKIFLNSNHRLSTVQIINTNKKRQTKWNQNEIERLIHSCPNLLHLVLDTLLYDYKFLQNICTFYRDLSSLEIYNTPLLDNSALAIIAKLKNLKCLGIGGESNCYNTILNLNGFQNLLESEIDLNILRLRYLSEVGDTIIKYLSSRFLGLLQFQVQRNSFQESASITNQSIVALKSCLKLTRVSIIYCREFSSHIDTLIIDALVNVKYLCLRSCPIYEDFVDLRKMKNLEELDLSGDSWIRPSSLQGIAKHQNIKIFWMGHFDHGETGCEEIIASYPPQGIYVENLFKNEKAFPALKTLYLEQCCTLTFWMDTRIKKHRPQLEIQYRKKQQFE